MHRIFFSASLPSYLALTFARFYFEDPIIFYGTSSIIVIYGILLLLASMSKERLNSVSNYVILALILSALVALSSGANDTTLVLPQLIANLGFARSIIHTNLNPKVYATACYTLFLFFFCQIAIDKDPEDVFTVSRNFISVLIILGTSFYFIACDQQKRKPSVMIPAIGLLILLWAIGRSGIASGALLFVGALFFSKRATTAGALATLVLGATLFLSLNPTLQNFDAFYAGIERLERLGTGGQRTDINSEYLISLTYNTQNLLLGTPLSTIRSVVEVDGNPHNSYIRLHAGFGLLGVTVLALAISATMARLLLTRRHLALLTLLVSLFRSTFDSAAFHGPLDIIIFYFIFSALHPKRIAFYSRKEIRTEEAK